MVQSWDGWYFSAGGGVLSDLSELDRERSGVESAICSYVYEKARERVRSVSGMWMNNEGFHGCFPFRLWRDSKSE